VTEKVLKQGINVQNLLFSSWMYNSVVPVMNKPFYPGLSFLVSLQLVELCSISYGSGGGFVEHLSQT